MQIHWYEGLFLLPHHLQRLQRNAFEDLQRERALSWAYPYGMIDMRLSEDDLQRGRIRFETLKAVMPSGLTVNFPDEAELPVLDVKENFNAGSFVVYLAVPLWFAARANCVNPEQASGSEAKILYRVVEKDWADENTGNNTKPMLERRVNARLLLENADRSDLETIPLLRVTRSVGEDVGLPRQDAEFVGPCLILNGSRSLKEIVRNLSAQLQASRQELLLIVNRGGFSMEAARGIQFEQMMRLQALNRASAKLDSLLAVPSVTPFTMYLEMRNLLCDLCALHPERDLFDTLAYDHDSPYLCFNELAQKIRHFLRGNVAPNFLKVPFVLQGNRLQADLTDEHFTRPTDYFLGIRTKEDPLALARIVENEDRFKLMPASLADRAIRGVVLQEERLPPLELPAQSGLYYFRLLRDQNIEVWNMLQAQKKAVVRWSDNDSADYQVTLYMTLPPESRL